MIALVHCGISRPGAMVHTIEGLTTKMLNERLYKLHRCGILVWSVSPGKPPRVVYRFTEFGRKFLKIIDVIGNLQMDIAAASAFNPGNETDE